MMEESEKKVIEIIERVMFDRDRTQVIERIKASGGPWYSADETRSDRIVKIEKDGTRTRGRVMESKFIPDES